MVFRSPVVHTPQRGRQVTTAYLSAAMTVLDGAEGEDRRFRYVGQLVDGDRALLEFETRLGDVSVHGVDLLTVDDDGRISEFTVLVRPLKAVHAVWEAMGAQLAARQGGSAPSVRSGTRLTAEDWARHDETFADARDTGLMERMWHNRRPG